jgi:hypothetical protein
VKNGEVDPLSAEVHMPEKREETSQSSSNAPAGRAAVGTAPPPVGSEEQYLRFLPEAEKLPAPEVRPLRADVSVAIANAGEGLDAVLDRADEVAAALPKLSMDELRGVADLGSALAFAAGQVERFAPPPGDAMKMLSRARKLRALLLGSADTLVLAGVLPAAQVARIHEGHRGLDTAGDCVALAALFRKNAAAVKGKVVFTASDLKETAEVGRRLAGMLRPKAVGNKGVAKELSAALEARDRLWTLFERRWEENVWRAGAWLFGRGVDDKVPGLLERVVKRWKGRKTGMGTTLGAGQGTTAEVGPGQGA